MGTGRAPGGRSPCGVPRRNFDRAERPSSSVCRNRASMLASALACEMKAAKPSWLPTEGRLARLLLCLCIVRLCIARLGSVVGAAYLLGVEAPHPCHSEGAPLSSHAPCGVCSYKARLGRAKEGRRAMAGVGRQSMAARAQRRAEKCRFLFSPQTSLDFFLFVGPQRALVCVLHPSAGGRCSAPVLCLRQRIGGL